MDSEIIVVLEMIKLLHQQTFFCVEILELGFL